MRRVIKSKITLGKSLSIATVAGCLALSNHQALAQSDSGASHTTANHQKQIIGYLPQWDAWKGDSYQLSAAGIYNQLNIDYSQYTMLNFSFFGVAKDGSLHSADLRNKDIYQDGAVQEPGELLMTDIYSSWDYWILYGEQKPIWYLDEALRAEGYDDDGTGGWVNETLGTSGSFPLQGTDPNGPKGLLELCQEKGVKCMASIGGWSMSKHFPEMAADETMRAKFIADCVELIDMGFDGIDIDWEYPGEFSGMNFIGSNADYENFAILMEEIRAAIGPDKLITAAFAAQGNKLAGFDWPRLSQSMDYFNMMTYDFHGGWDDTAGHNSPLFSYPNQAWGPMSWNDTVTALAEAGAPLEKVTMGAAFYGRGVTTVGQAAVHAPTVKVSKFIQPDGNIMTAADYTNWAVADGTPNYSLIVKSTSSWATGWDEDAKVPYKTNNNAFLSYDDERSIGLKAKLVADNELGGVIIWTAFGDIFEGPINGGSDKLPYCPTSDAPLVNTINSVLAGQAVPGELADNAFISVAANNVGISSSESTQLVFNVSLSAPLAGQASIDFTTQNGTAIAGTHYVASSGTLVFAAGETKKTIAIDIPANQLDAPVSFSIELENPQLASIASSTATATLYQASASASDTLGWTRHYTEQANASNTTYAEWKSNHGIVSDSEAVGSSGLAPVLVFLAGLTPADDTSKLVNASIQNLTVDGQTGDYFVVELDVSEYSQQVEYRIESSSDLSSWAAGPDQMVLHHSSQSNGLFHALWRSAAPVSDHDSNSLFLRLAARLVND
ncbi:glycosyl hydrolase family 18 protein [Persicirhabdus sediminis]|uniref:chitinase n=1 Tax=Persicirhabdus sediminis TaxID=454144 RepID=A0A8J7SLP5_9BACT|nr:glycosyl hydrolase family 18 protein [Persicirhabdus sediminis]MBK1792491.1 hypothetical protein [Persicirhabdus sediminis]